MKTTTSYRPRITIVDSEPSIRRFVACNLARRGYVVSGAASVQAAWPILQERLPALILLEPQMPGGPEFLNRLGQEIYLSRVPVLLFTTLDGGMVSPYEDHSGVVAVLHKPTSAADLIAAVSGLVGHHTELLYHVPLR